MKLTLLDIGIIVAYLTTMVVIGWVLRKRPVPIKKTTSWAVKTALVYAGTKRCV
ncbi:hypothetical protein [Paraflavitalea speifideaquila]|uniref:hypothetical protein n=1 Tax=Paraflavitalea speifideaquila TaxID=3076558 RepID=UPI0028F0F175|nr:hypothetical protein [Paraflavitalea speifideiaquila]